MPFCSKCGSEYQEGARFCSSCGHSIERSSLAAPTSAPQKGKKPLIAKFKMSNEDAFSKFTQWASAQKYVPKDFDINSLKDKIKKIYVPVFLFDVSAESNWHGTIV